MKSLTFVLMNMMSFMAIARGGSGDVGNAIISDVLEGRVVNPRGILTVTSCQTQPCNSRVRIGPGEKVIVLKADETKAKIITEFGIVGYAELNKLNLGQSQPLDQNTSETNGFMDLPNPEAASEVLEENTLDNVLAGRVVHPDGLKSLNSCASEDCARITRVGPGIKMLILKVEGSWAKVLVDYGKGTCRQRGYINVNDINFNDHRIGTLTDAAIKNTGLFDQRECQ